mmetsp:Transcript_20426/g.47900  ORF Transcript_20426/g.47900 Transcript_20426/m.47900 type:complete len:297 (+) Transcript_20426:43-933(+)
MGTRFLFRIVYLHLGTRSKRARQIFGIVKRTDEMNRTEALSFLSGRRLQLLRHAGHDSFSPALGNRLVILPLCHSSRADAGIRGEVHKRQFTRGWRVHQLEPSTPLGGRWIASVEDHSGVLVMADSRKLLAFLPAESVLIDNQPTNHRFCGETTRRDCSQRSTCRFRAAPCTRCISARFFSGARWRAVRSCRWPWHSACWNTLAALLVDTMEMLPTRVCLQSKRCRGRVRKKNRWYELSLDLHPMKVCAFRLDCQGDQLLSRQLCSSDPSRMVAAAAAMVQVNNPRLNNTSPQSWG